MQFELPPLPRFIFVVHGSAQIGGETVHEGEAWQAKAPRWCGPAPAA